MFEDKTPSAILTSMLNSITDYDTREGSVLYTALAPVAQELSALYDNIAQTEANSFVDTADLPHLILRAKERGIAYLDARQAIVSAAVTLTEGADCVAAGERFFAENGAVFVYHGAVCDDGVQILLQCEQAGEIGNLEIGSHLIYDGTATSVKSAVVTELVYPGRDAQTLEELRAVYYESLDAAPFAGNPADYREKALQIPGVGGVLVKRAEGGGGTVGLYLLDSDFQPASENTVKTAQNLFDPNRDGNLTGDGIAPINHIVSCFAAIRAEVNIEVSVEFTAGASAETTLEAVRQVLCAYIRTCAGEWADSGKCTVRIWRIESAVAGVDGILDARDAVINEAAENLTFSGSEVPVLGTVTLKQVSV